MLRKIFFALALTGISVSAFAGAPGNQMVTPSGVPLMALSNLGFWSFGIEGFYAQSTAPQFQYAQINSNTTPSNISNEKVDNSYHSGFEADATYHFADSDRDVTLAYMHLDMEDGNTASIVGNETLVDPFGLIPGRRDRVDQIKGSTDNLYNAADFVFGQHMHVGQVLDIHPFGGIRYADLNSRDNSTYYNDATDPDPIEATAQITSHFQGLGPRAGVDATFHINPAISFVGTIGSSLEVGYDNATTVLQINGDSPTTSKLNKAWYIVPEMDAKIGVDYQHSFNAMTSFNVQLGYQVVNYFNAVEEDYNDISTVNSENNRENFGFQGPYLRLQLNLA
jgi:hypothetical protein